MAPRALMEPVLEALARFVAETPEAAIPAAVREHATLVVADTVAAILAGSTEPEVVRLHQGTGRVAGPATLLGTRGAEAAWGLCEGIESLKDARELGDRLRLLEAGG